MDLLHRDLDGVTKGEWKHRWELAFDPIPGKTLFQTLKNSFELYSKRDFLGKIIEKSDENGQKVFDVQYETFEQVWEQIRFFSGGLSQLMGNSKNELISIVSKNRSEWVVADLSSMVLGWTSVPIPATVDVLDLSYILAHSEASCIVISESCLKSLLPSLESLPKLKLIIQMDKFESASDYINLCKNVSSHRNIAHHEPKLQFIKESGISINENDREGIFNNNNHHLDGKKGETITIVDFADVIQIGKQSPLTHPNIPDDEKVHLSTIVYTSGSTGRPKGVVNTYERWNIFISFLYNMPNPLVRLSFMPLAHNTERQQCHLTICYGGKMCFSRGDMETIFEDFELVQPTTLSAAPRFYDSIFNQYQAALAQFKNSNPDVAPDMAESYILSLFTDILGNNMTVLIVGGAAVSPSTKLFMQKCFKCPIFDGYGTTEAGGITADGRLYPGTEVKIVDCPELGYTSQDKPWPRGEIWAKTPSMVSGYYKDPETTKEYFKDGWFVTGDIVEVRDVPVYVEGVGNTIEQQFFIIDRRKNLFKLSQGVFVAPSAIENKLIESDYVHQIYVYGDHTRSALVAVVVPNFENLNMWILELNKLNDNKAVDMNQFVAEFKLEDKLDPSQRKGDQQSFAKYLIETFPTEFKQYVSKLPICRSKILRELEKTALKINLPPYHIPKNVLIEHETWNSENRLVTPSDKPLRGALEKKYKADIESMYQEISSEDQVTSKVSGTVNDVIKDVLRFNDQETHLNGNEDLFQQLATDSLTTLKLIQKLNQKLETNLSFSEIMNQTHGHVTAETIASLVSKKHQATSSQASDPWASQDPMILIDHEVFVKVDYPLITDFYNSPNLEKTDKNVFVTGATGFLGMHLIASLMEKFPEYTLYLLVRSNSKEEASERFFNTAQKQLGEEWKSHHTNDPRIQFVPGDLSSVQLGIENEEYNRLVTLIDVVYHVGAAVNWVWSYAALRGTNVLGTIEMLKFATTSKLKIFNYVSTISTASNIPSDSAPAYFLDYQGYGPVEETLCLSKREVVHHGAYTISKWVSECIVKRSISNGLPGCIYRPGMITAHSKTGACHESDFSSRLLKGLLSSKSLFNSDLLLEWMPVDYCADAIVTLSQHYLNVLLPDIMGASTYGVIPTFNIQNTHMVSYTTLAQFLTEIGIPMKIVSYKEWRESILTNENSPLWPLLPFFGESDCSMFMVAYRAPLTSHLLGSLGVKCPVPDAALFKIYTDRLNCK